jgi:transposase
MIPVFLKPKANVRRKRLGRKKSHSGVRRPAPEVIDRRADHRHETCPARRGPLTRTNQSRTRVTEDILEAITPVVTEHTIHRDWCPRCQKAVEPVVTEALPGATFGNWTLVLSAWLHYGLGNTLSQVVAVFNHHLPFRVTNGVRTIPMGSGTGTIPMGSGTDFSILTGRPRGLSVDSRPNRLAVRSCHSGEPKG